MAAIRRSARRRLTPDQRRAQIVDAAARVFARRDPGEVTFEEIAAEAGVSRALVYNYFGDKGGLLAAVYGASLAELDAELAQALTLGRAAGDPLLAVVEVCARHARERAGSWALLGIAAAHGHPAVLAARRARLDALAAAWGATPEARTALGAAIGAIEAALSDRLVTGEPSEERTVELLHELLSRGLGPLLESGRLTLELPAADTVVRLPR
ncbi:MAG: TetR/AcrR family transcriptional regulator [Acidimicrobiales bacterium]